MLNVGDIVALYDSVDNNLLHKYVIVEENITLAEKLKNYPSYQNFSSFSNDALSTKVFVLYEIEKHYFTHETRSFLIAACDDICNNHRSYRKL